jgi:fumarylacetoacetase
MLDVEVEVGFVTGTGPPLGTPIDAATAEDHIFGLVLVNDWSARDLQSWEYQPLGPFLAKSFLTSVSPWVVPLDALAPFRVTGPRQEPAPLPYLRVPEPRGVDLRLELRLRTAAMAAAGEAPVPISTPSFAGMYWSMAQQLAHLTVNGASLRAGDLCASGTVSGSSRGSEGSLMELTWRGTRPLVLPSGEERSFLEDGDEVTIRATAPGVRGGRIALGEVTGTVLPAE